MLPDAENKREYKYIQKQIAEIEAALMKDDAANGVLDFESAVIDQKNEIVDQYTTMQV